ncbi:hypothetical protein EON81_26050 [bacterium]|nr:MAG: hypothetical protein EON81_26050 [bacterium]
MCDDTGLFQHAKYTIPNRAEGYCIDDNVRMLILAVNENLDDLANLATTFTEYGYSAETGLFRNFMAYDRRWLETVGSDDSNGRTIWALATALNHSNDPSVREIARELLEPALQNLPDFEHLRSHAFVALGVAQMPDARAEPILRRIATRLKRDFARNADEAANWVWFEEFLSYDNARMCEAAIRTGVALEDEELIEIGFRSLTWLTEVQTDRRGMFAPIGCNGFFFKGGERARFDQQPLEAAATIAALLAANEVRPDLKLIQQAENTFAWFLGRNAVGAPLADVATGGCCDGILPSGINRNMGAESTLAYLMALSDLRRALPHQAVIESVPVDVQVG